MFRYSLKVKGKERFIVEKALAEIVYKMSELGFKDDEYRNRSAGNKLLNLQYFFKRQEDSSWEVYSSYNPVTGMLTMNYFNIYEDATRFPVFFINVSNDRDAKVACHLLELKTNYLWSGNVKKAKQSPERTKAIIQKMGFELRNSENNISTWVCKTDDCYYTLMIENGVSLSLYLFKGDPKGKAKVLLALRNIHEENAIEACLAYTSSKMPEGAKN